MTSPVTGNSPYSTSDATSSVDRPDQNSSDMFLKLLVAEMKYQDPSSPMSTSDMMSQTATLTQTQSLQDIAKQNAQLVAMQQSLSAAALVGQTVSYTDTDGATKSGTVTGVKVSSTDNTSQVVVGGASVDVGRITVIGKAT